MERKKKIIRDNFSMKNELYEFQVNPVHLVNNKTYFEVQYRAIKIISLVTSVFSN